MYFTLSWALAGLALGSLTLASPIQMDKRSTIVEDGVKYTVFEHAATNSVVKFVTNSGICETTPGVNQYSGYFSVGGGANYWFWFFEARNNPTTAPLATWFNGGPGCSSMIGLFQENGPCQFYNGASTPSLNPYSFNNFANMLYIDQPAGTGFSYGTDSVTSTVTAAPFVWALLQAFYTQFPQYESREFGIFTESYGGHYGPEFAYYIEQQNAKIAAGSITGHNIDIIALGVNDGWFDPIIQYKAYITYAQNNPYNNIISQSDANSYMSAYTNDCVPALQACQSSGSNSDCSNAQNVCYNEIEGAITQQTDFDVYDVREPSQDPYPPSTYSTYLTKSSVMKAIGAKQTYQECPNGPYNKFAKTGDDSRSTLPQLSSVVSSGIQTLIWAGDADYICNRKLKTSCLVFLQLLTLSCSVGGLAAAEAISWSGQSTFKSMAQSSYKVNGVAGGTFKTVKNLSWITVFGAGHEVPYYTPALALQAFTQTMQKKAVFST